MTLFTLSLIWIGTSSLYSFVRMGWDKQKANQKEWRTSEKHFFIVAAVGGSLGVLLGMQVWRHKTQKWAFKLPIYGIVTIQLILLYFYWFVWQ